MTNPSHPSDEPNQTTPTWLASGGPPPDVLLWRPSLAVLLLAGVVAGGTLGAANGALCQAIVGLFDSPLVAALWGMGLGILGGVGVVLLRRAVWGPEVGVEVGTLLGMLYGIAPGLAILFQSIIVTRAVSVWGLAGMVMAGSMVGLVVGGVLDRLTETVLARMKRSHHQDR